MEDISYSENIEYSKKIGKPILDNCTIYRMLDKMDEKTQRERTLNALASYQEETEELSKEKNELWSSLLEQLSENDLEEVSKTIIELILNNEDERRDKNELLIIKKRLEYLDGNITLEKMQSFIHDLLLDDDYYLFQIEYQVLLYKLLKTPPEEYSINFIENIKRLKAEAIKKQLNPSCNYPN